MKISKKLFYYIFTAIVSFSFIHVTYAAEEDECIICYEKLQNTNEKGPERKLSCGHTFHRDCIEEWHRKSKHANCPICRVPIQIKDLISKKSFKRNNLKRLEKQREIEQETQRLQALQESENFARRLQHSQDLQTSQEFARSLQQIFYLEDPIDTHQNRSRNNVIIYRSTSTPSSTPRNQNRPTRITRPTTTYKHTNHSRNPRAKNKSRNTHNQTRVVRRNRNTAVQKKRNTIQQVPQASAQNPQTTALHTNTNTNAWPAYTFFTPLELEPTINHTNRQTNRNNTTEHNAATCTSTNTSIFEEIITRGLVYAVTTAIIMGIFNKTIDKIVPFTISQKIYAIMAAPFAWKASQNEVLHSGSRCLYRFGQNQLS